MTRSNSDQLHLRACARKSNKSAMYLKREPPKSLPKLPLIRIASHKEAARKDPAVHVSLSSDSLFKQPGDREIPSPHQPGSRRSAMHPKTIGCRFTVPVRSFRGAQSRCKRTARRWPVYRLRLIALSTANGLLLGLKTSKIPLGHRPFRAVGKTKS